MVMNMIGYHDHDNHGDHDDHSDRRMLWVPGGRDRKKGKRGSTQLPLNIIIGSTPFNIIVAIVIGILVTVVIVVMTDFSLIREIIWRDGRNTFHS